MRMRLSWISILFVVVGCQFQASCGTKKIDMTKAKDFVASTLERELGQKPTETTCPRSVAAEKGKTFECTAKFGAAVATVTIDQNDDQGNVTIKSVTGILISSKLEKQIADHFGKQMNAHVEVACGDRIRPSNAGDTFTCDAKDAAGATAKVNVQVKDATGAVDFALAKP